MLHNPLPFAALAAATFAVSACQPTDGAMTAAAPTGDPDAVMTAQLAGKRVTLTPDAQRPNEPESITMTFGQDGMATIEMGGTVVLRDGPVALALQMPDMTEPWSVVNQQICLGAPDNLDCVDARVSGNTLIVDDDGRPGRGELVPM